MSTVYSGKWAYSVTGDDWVTTVTHLPSMATYEASLPLARVRQLASIRALLATVADVDDLCKACSKPYAEYATYHFCRACLAVGTNLREQS